MDETQTLRREIEARFLRDLRDEHIRSRALLEAARRGATPEAEVDADGEAAGGASDAPGRSR